MENSRSQKYLLCLMKTTKETKGIETMNQVITTKEWQVEIIEPSVEAITELDIWKRLEMIGRVCYKSEHKITKDSALPFCEMLFNKKHLSVFEHIWVPREHGGRDEALQMTQWVTGSAEYNHPFSKMQTEFAWIAITRQHLDYPSFRFTCDRGIANQLVRHKGFAFMQESTRYVKYDKCLPVIRPLPFKWANDQSSLIYQDWLQAMLKSAETYQGMVQSHGLSAQEARIVLPLSTKTELIMTGSKDQFARLYKVRSGSDCHPQMRHLMELFKPVAEKQGIELK